MKMQPEIRKDNILVTLLTGLLCICLAAPAMASVKAQLERDTVYEGDPVTLIIESDGQHSGQPDLAPLNRDFRITGNSTSTQVSIINGRRSDKTSWIVQLEPRHKGTLQIPPISVGDEQTSALVLEVTDIPEHIAGEQSGHVFLEVEVDTDDNSLYVQQQLPYTVRLYYDDKILNGELEQPQPEQAVVEQLGDDKQYTATRNGQRYHVIERHYVISPEKSGLLHIPPATFKGLIASAQEAPGQRSRHNRLIDRFFANSPFANDPFFGSAPFADPGQPIRMHSKAINIDVQPRPASAGDTWLPAEQLTLQDSWTGKPPQFRVGEPVTRTITLQAKGLTGAQIPVIQQKQPEQTRLYPEPPVNESRTDGDKVYGISKQTFTYIPNKAGKLTIPAIDLQWWNTRTNQQDTSTLTKWEVSVAPGIGGVQTNAVDTQDNYSQPANGTTLDPELPLKPENWLENVKTFKHWPATGITLLMSIIALFTLMRSRKSKRGEQFLNKEKPAANNARLLIKTLLAELEESCATNNANGAAHALLKLGHTRWPDNPPGSLGVLATRLDHGRGDVLILDRVLYSAGKSAWDGADLWMAIKDTWHTDTKEQITVEDDLRPLYPTPLNQTTDGG